MVLRYHLQQIGAGFCPIKPNDHHLTDFLFQRHAVKPFCAAVCVGIGVGVAYTLDVVRWVPYIGLMTSGFTLPFGGPRTAEKVIGDILAHRPARAAEGSSGTLPASLSSLQAYPDKIRALFDALAGALIREIHDLR